MSQSEPKPSVADALKHFYGVQVNAERRGWQKFCCPLHADSSPSASVNVEAGRWSCFVCNLSEDSYAIVMRELSCGFPEAKEFAHQQFRGSGEDLPRDVPGKPGRVLRSSPGPRGTGRKVRTGIRPFGSTWS
ncbi:CHC2 zinc finger domain-containing protein [Streptomyces sp. NPDC047967]|uniref:CHC2 zinc finger domain-containing protein n=1 Tax=Streptomyces sp. NPDC047967 TaxID=3154924 RepID=UPI0033E065ED